MISKAISVDILLFCIILIITFTIEPIDQIFAGYNRILTSPRILISDYLHIGGLAATLLNV